MGEANPAGCISSIVDHRLVITGPPDGYFVIYELPERWRKYKMSRGCQHAIFYIILRHLCQLQVADCGRREFTDQKRVEMSVSDFISHWLELFSKDCTYASGNGHTLLYLKD
ncbi:hypothetical protein NE237_018863 [Protea cynaroides]|uniref:Uncharacterized protein n=1 Tax=Protea cynaroides TaxID=273540 RepID=A0A9Q0KAT1_9MAGN|nr:hypothetical protein NE237_018863 [Protea cynaroides]